MAQGGLEKDHVGVTTQACLDAQLWQGLPHGNTTALHSSYFESDQDREEDLSHLHQVQIFKRHVSVPWSTWEALSSPHEEAGHEAQEEPETLKDVPRFTDEDRWPWAEPNPDLSVTSQSFVNTATPCPCFTHNGWLFPA